MCEHNNFESNVIVSRILDSENGQLTNFMANLKIKCLECGLPFEFIGFEAGFSFLKPMMSSFGQELRLPIKPTSDPVDNVNAILNQ